MYGYTYRPSAAKRQEFHEKMLEIEAFCKKHGISASRNNDSYYFSINGQRYRVSNIPSKQATEPLSTNIPANN